MSSDKGKGKSGTPPKYLYQQTSKQMEDGFVVQREEYIVDGERGIKIKFFSIDKKDRKKVVILRNKDGKFMMKVSLNGKEDEQNLSIDELTKRVKDDKDLKFVVDFLKTQKGGEWAMERTKRSSKKSSKKESTKSSKKSSKKGSMKGGKKNSKKSSKKKSKKTSKK